MRRSRWLRMPSVRRRSLGAQPYRSWRLVKVIAKRSAPIAMCEASSFERTIENGK